MNKSKVCNCVCNQFSMSKYLYYCSDKKCSALDNIGYGKKIKKNHGAN